MLTFLNVRPGLHGGARWWAARLAVAVALAGLPFVAGAQAAAAQEALDEVSRLLDEGKAEQAAKRAEGHLRQHPADVQMRFLQGVIAAERGQGGQAVEIFSALTRDHPNLPEPYNNLAVLYAAQGDERKASEVLERAIRTNPSYATAHENLGDLYARMASEAYAKALQLDESRQAIRPKLALITQIFPAQNAAVPVPRLAQAQAVGRQEAGAPVAVPDRQAQARQAAEKTAGERAAQARAEQADAARLREAQLKAAADQARTAEDARLAAERASKARAAAAKPAAGAGAAPEGPGAAADIAALESAVRAWAAAWAGQDIERYLAAYSAQFRPADGSSLPQWQEQRRQRIVGRPAISVVVRDLKVSVDGDAGTAQFRQSYASGAYKATTRKVLRLRREAAGWRIVHEGAGG